MATAFDSFNQSLLGEHIQSTLGERGIASASAFIGLASGLVRIADDGSSHALHDTDFGALSSAHAAIDFAGTVYITSETEFGAGTWRYNAGDTVTFVGGSDTQGFGLEVFGGRLHGFSAQGTQKVQRYVSGTTWEHLMVGQTTYCDPTWSFFHAAFEAVVFGEVLAIICDGAPQRNCGGPFLTRVLAFWDGSSFSIPDLQPHIGNEGGRGNIALYAGDLYVNQPGTANLFKWTGSAWVEITGLSGGQILDLFAHQGVLYIAGNFTGPSPGLAKYDGNTVSAVTGIGSGKGVESLHRLSDGRLLLGGSTNLNGTNTSVLAFDGDTFSNPFSQNFGSYCSLVYQSSNV